MNNGLANTSFQSFNPSPGIRLRYAFVPAKDSVKHTVILLHGRGEFIEKYEEVLSELQARGYDTWTFDWRGQGLSSRPLHAYPRRGHIDDFGVYLNDLRCFLERVVGPNMRSPQAPLLLGHSMGGHIAIRYGAEGGPVPIGGLILSAPLIALKLPLPDAALMRLAQRAVRMGLGHRYAIGQGDPQPRRFRNNPWTSDAVRFERLRELIVNDPRLGLGGITYGWLHAAINSMRRISDSNYPNSISVPSLVVVAGEDRVVSTSATRNFVAKMPRSQLVTLPQCRHEILIEDDTHRRAFWRAYDHFMATDGSAAQIL